MLIMQPDRFLMCEDLSLFPPFVNFSCNYTRLQCCCTFGCDKSLLQVSELLVWKAAHTQKC